MRLISTCRSRSQGNRLHRLYQKTVSGDPRQPGTNKTPEWVKHTRAGGGVRFTPRCDHRSSAARWPDGSACQLYPGCSTARICLSVQFRPHGQKRRLPDEINKAVFLETAFVTMNLKNWSRGLAILRPHDALNRSGTGPPQVNKSSAIVSRGSGGQPCRRTHAAARTRINRWAWSG